jgi:hypothetical protein
MSGNRPDRIAKNPYRQRYHRLKRKIEVLTFVSHHRQQPSDCARKPGAWRHGRNDPAASSSAMSACSTAMKGKARRVRGAGFS